MTSLDGSVRIVNDLPESPDDGTSSVAAPNGTERTVSSHRNVVLVALSSTAPRISLQRGSIRP